MAAIVAAARAMLGTPFRHQGRSPGAALDCAGLIVEAGRAAGLAVFDVPAYSRHSDGRTLKCLMDSNLSPAPPGMVEPGMVLLFSYEGDAHLAIATDHPGGGLGMIHASARARRVVENAIDSEWAARLVRAYQVPKCS